MHNKIPFIIFFLTLTFAINHSIATNNNNSSNIKVTPTEVLFDAKQQSATIKIKNLVKEKVYLKAQLLKWEHNQNTNRYTPSDDLFLKSELLTIDGDKESIVQIYRKSQKPTAAGNDNSSAEQTELSYRLLLSELAVPSTIIKSDHEPRTENRQDNTKILQSISMPIFINPNQLTDNQPIKWNKKVINNNSIELSIYNPNNSHRLINKITLKNKRNQNLYQQQNAFIYLLAKQKYTWNIELNNTKNQKIDLNNLAMDLSTSYNNHGSNMTG